MKKINFIIILLVLVSSFSTSCQSIKDGLSGRKSENSDEFLVQKKNPLVTPPDFMKLPKPDDDSSVSENLLIDEQTDIQKLFEINENSKKISKSKFGKAEEFVLENLK
tara:strand:+ start:94 stop:417 length:324 start_codon:yes stop_codon:yes gene_type:complete